MLLLIYLLTLVLRVQYQQHISGALSPVSIQTQLLALRKRKPQETQALALTSSKSWLPLLRPSIPIGWRKRKHLRFLRFSFTQRTQRKRLCLNRNRALHFIKATTLHKSLTHT